MCVGISKEQGALWAGALGLGPCAATGAWLRVQGGFIQWLGLVFQGVSQAEAP